MVMPRPDTSKIERIYGPGTTASSLGGAPLEAGSGPGGQPPMPGFVPAHLQGNPYLASQKIAEDLYKAGQGPSPYGDREPEIDPFGRMRLENAELQQRFDQQLASLKAQLDAEYAQTLGRARLVAPRPAGMRAYA